MTREVEASRRLFEVLNIEHKNRWKFEFRNVMIRRKTDGKINLIGGFDFKVKMK